MLELVILIIALFITYGYLVVKRRHEYWEKLGVPYLKPDSLFFGNNYGFVSGKLSIAEQFTEHYNNLAPHRFGGVYHFQNPFLIIRDPELIKNVLIKDFHYFHDRSLYFANKDDPLSLHLVNLSGEEWRFVRNKLSPTFTSGKMKILFGMMRQCANKLNGVIDKRLDDGPLEAKDLMTRYTTDVISSCAFGLEADTLNGANSNFFIMGKERFSPTLRARLRDAMFALCPKLVRLLGYQELSPGVSQFFIDLVRDTIEYRKKNGVSRNDFLNIIMELLDDDTEKIEKLDFNMGLLIAQCFLFFIAGFETSSSLLSFILHELAGNQTVQKKLQDEVDQVLGKNEGLITYESLHTLSYMEKVMNETLRLYPPGARLLRICTADYQIPDSDYVVKSGTVTIIPACALHRDPQYFSNPDVFDPDVNFSDEAKASRSNYCFLPFSLGPRNCIGLRFAIMQVKLALVMMMKDYTVTRSPNMKLPVKWTPWTPLLSPASEVLLHFERRR